MVAGFDWLLAICGDADTLPLEDGCPLEFDVLRGVPEYAEDCRMLLLLLLLALLPLALLLLTLLLLLALPLLLTLLPLSLEALLVDSGLLSVELAVPAGLCLAS